MSKPPHRNPVTPRKPPQPNEDPPPELSEENKRIVDKHFGDEEFWAEPKNGK